MNQQRTVIVKEETVRKWINDAFANRPTKKPDPDDLASRATRKLPDFRGKAEKRPLPRSSLSNMGKADALHRVLKHLGDAQIKIGDRTFKTVAEPDYRSWHGTEWTEDDLPVKGQCLKSTSGILLDLKKAKDKLNLARVVPEFVMQMHMKAVEDYRASLVEATRIVKLALQDYVKDILLEAGDDIDASEREMLTSDRGLAYLSSSPEFQAYFQHWKLGTYRAKDGSTYHGAPPNIARLLSKGALEVQSTMASKIRSVMNIARRLGTLDVMHAERAGMNLSSSMGLDTVYDPNATKVDAAIILTDPDFRYFVGGRAGAYWDWVRNGAEAIGEYPSGQKDSWAQF